MSRIAIDIDGVLYEWERTARYMLREYRDYRDRSDGLYTASTHWDYIQERVRPEDWRWLWDEGVKLGLFRYGHVTKGAIVALRELLKSDHDLLVVTHRPKSAVQDTLAWLTYLNIPWTEVHILSNGEPKTQVDAEVLVDDKKDNVEAWRHDGRVAVLFDRPWNRDRQDELRGYGWENTCHVVRQICCEGLGRKTRV